MKGRFQMGLAKMRQHRGFTLLELLVVMAIMALLMAGAIAGFYGIGEGARMRGALTNLQSTLGLARQRAILRNVPLTVVFFRGAPPPGQPPHYYVAKMENGVEDYRLGEPVYLPPGIRFGVFEGFEDPANPKLTFHPDGAAGAATYTIPVSQERESETWNVKVFGLTGLTSMRLIGP